MNNQETMKTVTSVDSQAIKHISAKLEATDIGRTTRRKLDSEELATIVDAKGIKKLTVGRKILIST